MYDSWKLACPDEDFPARAGGCVRCTGEGSEVPCSEECADTLPAPPLEEDKMCGRCARVFDQEAWDALEYVGFQSDGSGGGAELRNCVCGDTMAIYTEGTKR